MAVVNSSSEEHTAKPIEKGQSKKKLVGAGDSMVAGYNWIYPNQDIIKKAFKWSSLWNGKHNYQTTWKLGGIY